MAYTQSPANVLKGQMTNKAVGLAHGDSMAMQTDPKDGVTVTGKKTMSQKKKDLLNTIKAQGEYDRNRSQNVLPELAEIDSLAMVEKGDRYGAQKMYGPKFEANTASRLPSSVTKEKRRELYKQAQEVQGPRPSL
jgi:hypothetical protein